MAVKTSYTASELKSYMYHLAGSEASTDIAQLGWTVGNGDFDEAFEETHYIYGTDDITTISGREDTRKLRACARVALWQTVQQRVTVLHDHSQSDAGTDNLSDVYDHAARSLRMAEMDLARIDPGKTPGYSMKVHDSVKYNDPYTTAPSGGSVTNVSEWSNIR